MERTTDYAQCPVHNTLLQPNYYLGINVWHCAKCAIYYAKGKNGSMTSNVTINGTPILFNEKLSIISKEELIEQQKAVQERKFIEHYESLPDSSELLICPLHQKILLSKNATLDFAGTKITTPIGYCNHCDTMYMNSLQTALLGDTIYFGKQVTWVPIKFKHSMKSREPIYPNIKLKIRTNDIAMVDSKKDIAVPQIFVGLAIAEATLQNRGTVDIDGYYVASTKRFYTTPNQLFSRVSLEECAQLHISDPQDTIRNYIRVPIFQQQQKAIEKREAKIARIQQEKQKIENNTLKQNIYTLPLLKGDDEHCPFCGRIIHKSKFLKAVIYHEKVAANTRRISCLFCKHCQVPFISLSQEIDTLNAIRPRMIYVFDARTCSNAQELLQRATQKYKKRPESVNNRVRLPLEAELEEGKPLPNLSFDLKTSKILVYANNCHCAACKKKYQQNTIRNRAALVKTVDGKTVKVNVEFCAGCGRYFMNITSFQQYCKRYGTILIECMMEHSLITHNETWFYFAPDTILSRCGYSVKQGISRTHRQAVLAYILDSGKASKYEVLEIISKFIRMRKSYQPGACERWREDIEFVNQYKIQSQETVEGLTFQQKGTYRP